MAVVFVWYLQFYQPMVLNSLVVSFIPFAILSLQSQTDDVSATRNMSIVSNIMSVLIKISLVLISTFAFNLILKVQSFDCQCLLLI